VRQGIFVFACGESLSPETNHKMALHRNIYWVGRQWAVTGYGIQACDQKQKSKFDIEASRLWEDGVLERMRTERWLNIEDFDRAIAVARTHYPEPPRKTEPPEESVSGSIEAVSKDAGLKEIGLKATGLKEASLNGASQKQVPVEKPKPAAPTFEMRVEGWPAKFVPQWRIRIKR
jgi:hypothetical protein